MNIYPAIDILGGKAVRLRQGRYDDVTIYGEPMDMAARWVQAGASWLHIVDLDGSRAGAPRNHEHIAAIAEAFPELKIQVGGGIRNMETVESLYAAGVERAVLGTILVTDPAFAAEALKHHGARIVGGIDARDGFARVSGWTEDSKIAAIDLAKSFEDRGAKLVVYTDIARDGLLTGPNVEALTHMLENTGLEVIASGGVSKLGDLRNLAGMNHPRLEGAIVGKALYEGLLDLAEAIRMTEHAG